MDQRPEFCSTRAAWGWLLQVESADSKLSGAAWLGSCNEELWGPGVRKRGRDIAIMHKMPCPEQICYGKLQASVKHRNHLNDVKSKIAIKPGSFGVVS